MVTLSRLDLAGGQCSPEGPRRSRRHGKRTFCTATRNNQAASGTARNTASTPHAAPQATRKHTWACQVFVVNAGGFWPLLACAGPSLPRGLPEHPDLARDQRPDCTSRDGSEQAWTVRVVEVRSVGKDVQTDCVTDLGAGVGAFGSLCLFTRTRDIDMPPWHIDICCQ